jgi:predicted transcriptional regulator
MTEIVAVWSFLYYKNLMQKRPVKKRSRGRPATGHDRAITVRLPKKLIRTLDKQAAAESKTRSEVIRALLDPPPGNQKASRGRLGRHNAG